MLPAIALTLAAIALCLATAATLLWLRTDRRAQRAQAQVAEILQRELEHQRARSIALELTLDSYHATHHGDLDPLARDRHLQELAASSPAHSSGAVAVVAPRPGALPVEIERELEAMEDAEAREELRHEAIRLHAQGEPTAGIVAALFEGA